MSTQGEGSQFVCYVEQPQTVRKSAWRRSMVAVGLVSVALCATVMYVATPPADEDLVLMSKMKKAGIVKGLKHELKAAHKPTEMSLALAIIKHASTASVSTLHSIISNWQDEQVSMDDSVGKSKQMLAYMPAITQSLEEESALCSKKDIIFEKFEALLKKLGHENVDRNASDEAAYQAKQAALGAWLDGESSYRLEIEKKKEAKKGAEFARASYEKWKAATLDTQERLDAMEAKYPKEKANIAAERELIKTIMRLLGILDDQPLDEKSKEAGGYWDKTIDHPNAEEPPAAAEEKAVVSKAKLAQVKKEIAKLKTRVAAGDSGIKLAMINKLESKLASFAETDFIKNLLMQMLKELDMRDEVLDSALEETKKEVESHKEKLRKYEIEVVDLSNAADKASERAASRNLERQKLNGEKINTAENYDNEHAEFAIIAPPAERAIFIIRTIMKKIEDHCTNGTPIGA